VVFNIKRYFDGGLSQMKTRLAQSRLRPPYHLSTQNLKFLDDDINYIIVPYAIELLVEQWRVAKENTTLPRCTGFFTETYGIPCCHSIRQAIGFEAKLGPSHFHHHWYYKRPGLPETVERPLTPTPPAVREPAVVTNPRGRPKDRSTRRDPSHWEQEAKEATQRASQR
jgi:hypothetical protein